MRAAPPAPLPEGAHPDRALTVGLAPPARLVFVLGPHRGGTTYLYQGLAERYALAPTTLHHVRHFPLLLTAAMEGQEAALKARLAGELQALGILDRGIDGVRVGPDALEEYAFVLRRWGGAWRLNARTGPTLDALIAKQSALMPEAEGVLLKNPFDYPDPAALLARYPQAKLVVIRRDPLRVLHSQHRNGLLYRREVEPYQRLLLEGMRLERWAYGLLPHLQGLVSEARFARWSARLLAKQLAQGVLAHQASAAKLPAGALHALSYEGLLANPAAELARLDAFLGLAPREGASWPERQARREPLHPEVAKQGPWLRAALAGTPEGALLDEAQAP